MLEYDRIDVSEGVDTTQNQLVSREKMLKVKEMLTEFIFGI